MHFCNCQKFVQELLWVLFQSMPFSSKEYRKWWNCCIIWSSRVWSVKCFWCFLPEKVKLKMTRGFCQWSLVALCKWNRRVGLTNTCKNEWFNFYQLTFCSSGQPRITTLTTPQLCWRSGWLSCRNITIMSSGDRWTSPRKSKCTEPHEGLSSRTNICDRFFMETEPCISLTCLLTGHFTKCIFSLRMKSQIKSYISIFSWFK